LKNHLSEIELHLEGIDPMDLYGEQNTIVEYIQQQFSELLVTARGDVIKIQGEKKQSQKLKKILEILIRVLKDEKKLNLQRVQDIVSGSNPAIARISDGDTNKAIVFGRNGQPIKAKTRNQKKMVHLCEDNDIVFVVGPAGTGKTYTAVALAVRALKNRLVKKIILTRPAVEAGENLGFLPGDMKDKVDPYLRPLYDALEDMIQMETLKQFIANRVIEVAPLAFMRGRTLDHAYIILDEAQNTTTMQIKMFLTRLGPNAKAIVTGDMSQVDLPRNQESGLRKAISVLKGLEGIATITMGAEDVVRHRLVKEIIIAYDKAGRKTEEEE